MNFITQNTQKDGQSPHNKHRQAKHTLLTLFTSLCLANHSFAAGIPTIDVGSLTQSILSFQETVKSNLQMLKSYESQLEQMKEQGIGMNIGEILGETKAVIDKTIENIDYKIEEDTFQETTDITNVCAYLEQNSKYFKDAINKVDKKLSNKVNACITTASTDKLSKTIDELKAELDNLDYEEVEKRNEIEHKINMLNQAQNFLKQQSNNQKTSKILTLYDNYLEGDSSNPYSKAKMNDDLRALSNQLKNASNQKQATALTNTMLLKLLEVSQKQYELSLNIASMNANESKSDSTNTLTTNSYQKEKPKTYKVEDLQITKSFNENFEEATYNEYGFPAFTQLDD